MPGIGGFLEQRIYRPRVNTFYFITAAVFLALFTIQELLYGEFFSGLSALFWSLGLSLLAYYSFIHSRIIFTIEGIAIRNPFSRVEIGWDEVAGMDDQLNFVVFRGSEKFSAWIAPGKRKLNRRGFYRFDRIRDASAVTSQDMERREFERTANPALFIAQEFQREFKRAPGRSLEFINRREDSHIRNILIAFSLGIAFAILA